MMPELNVTPGSQEDLTAETTQRPVSLRAEWETKIKRLEEEKTSLQREIARIKEDISVADLEKKFAALEDEVMLLRTTKLGLEKQLTLQLKTTHAEVGTHVEKPAQTPETVKHATQNQPSNNTSLPLRCSAM